MNIIPYSIFLNMEFKSKQSLVLFLIVYLSHLDIGRPKSPLKIEARRRYLQL